MGGRGPVSSGDEWSQVSLAHIKERFKLRGPTPRDTRISFYDEVHLPAAMPRAEPLILTVTTRDLEVPKAEMDRWPEGAVDIVNRLASERRGRSLFCALSTDQIGSGILSAIAYSLQDRDTDPLLLYAIAIRRDPLWRHYATSSARLLKRYLHAFALLMERPPDLLLKSPDNAVAFVQNNLEFQRAPRDPGIRGGTLMREAIPPDLVVQAHAP